MAQGSIHFHYLEVNFPFQQRTRLKEFLLQLFKKEGREVAFINYVFCTDAYLLKLNKQYLQHDTLTDIITFPLSGNFAPLTSDIFISIDRVKENSRAYLTSFQKELHRVIFHGALHLCGYKDKTRIAEKLMRSKEEEYLAKYLFHVK